MTMKADDKYKNLINPSAFWDPFRYYALGAYVTMYNLISNNPIKYGLKQQNYDIQINAYIKSHFDELSNELGLNFRSYQDITGKNIATAKRKMYSIPYVKEDFLNDFDSLVSEARRVSGLLNDKGRMMNTDELYGLLKAKEDDAKGYYENIRINSKYKTSNFSSEKGKDKSGIDAVAWERAQVEDEEKRTTIRRNGWKTFLTGFGTVAFGVGAVASGGLLLSYGGLALGSLFGAAASTAGLGVAVAGGVGAIASVSFARRLFNKFIESRAKGKVFRKDYRDYKNGIGKYVDKDGRAQSYFGRKDAYYRDLALKAYMDACGKYWKELLGYGKNGVTKSYEDILQEVPKHLRKYLKGKYVRNFPLKKIAEEGIFTAFVNDGPGSKGGFTNLFKARSKFVNEYKMYEKSLPEIINIYNDFFSSTEPEVVNQRNDIEAVIGKLGDLKKLSDKFKEAGDSGNSSYNDLMDKFSYQIQNTMTHSLFNLAYTDKLINQIDKALVNENVQEALDKGPSDIRIESVKSMVKFLQSEHKSKALDSSLGVNAVDQIMIRKDNMIHACTAFIPANDTSGLSGEVEAIATQIESLASKTDAATIRTQIDALSNTQVQQYLNFMLNRKESETKKTHAEILNTLGGDPKFVAIANDIASITNSEDAASIKNSIINDVNLSQDEKTQAIKQLNDQVKILEDQKRTKIREKALAKVQTGALPKLDDYLKQISDFKDIDVDKMYDLHYQLSRLSPQEIRDYLLFRFKDRVTKNFENNITNNKRFRVTEGNYSAAITDIREYLMSLSTAVTQGYMDAWQQDKCIDLIGPKITAAFDSYLENIEKTFLEDSDKKRQTITDYCQKTIINGGMFEYLSENTVECVALRRRMQRIIDANNVKTLMSANTKIIGDILDEKSSETQTTMKIYFTKDRDDADPLVKCLKRFREITQDTSSDTNCPERITATSNMAEEEILNPGSSVTGLNLNHSFVSLMLKELDPNNPNTSYNQITNEEDKIAALLVMKKRVAAILKLQMYKLWEKNKATYPHMSDFITHYGSTLFDGVKKKWAEIAKKIDDEITRISASSNVRTQFKVVANVQDMIENACNASNYSSFSTSKEMI